jgi:hypothetical protein
LGAIGGQAGQLDDHEPGGQGVEPGAVQQDVRVGAVLAEQHDERTEKRRYIGLDVLARCRPATATPEKTEEVTLTAITA